jgi:hypothetical protein
MKLKVGKILLTNVAHTTIPSPFPEKDNCVGTFCILYLKMQHESEDHN